MRIQNQSPMNLFEALGGMMEQTASGKASDFVSLLRKVTGQTEEAAIGMGGAGKGKQDRTKHSSVSQEYGDVTVSMAQLAGTAPQQPDATQPQGESESTPAGVLEAVEQGAQKAVAMDMAVEVPLAGSIAQQDEALIDLQQAAGAQAAAEVSEETQIDAQPKDKFGAMLEEAHQQLQSISVTQVEEVAEESGLPEVEQVSEPAGEQSATIAPEEGPKEPGQTSGETPDQQQSGSQQGSSSSVLTMDQKPMSEMPEQDRLLFEMKDTRPEQEKETTQVAAAEPRPDPVQTTPEREVQPAAPQPQAAPETEQADQIRAEAVRQMQQGKTEFRMQLTPEELGKVDVRMMLEGNRLAVEILAASPKAAELLSRQAEGLAQSLRLQEFDVQSIQVVTETQTTGSHMDGAFNMLNGGQAQDGWEETGTGHGGPGGSSEQGDAQADITVGSREQSPDTLVDYAI